MTKSKPTRLASRERSSSATKPSRDVVARHARAALDASPTPWLLLDRDWNVTHANHAAESLVRDHGEELRAHGARIDAVRWAFPFLEGAIDRPRSNPASGEASSRVAHSRLGDSDYEVHISPLCDARGRTVGHALEWHEVVRRSDSTAEETRFEQAVEQASTALMMIDENLTITYVNEATRRLLREREAELRGHFPGFSVDTLVGTHIDTFHARPENQHRILRDVDAMPRKTMIRVGRLSFSTQLNAVFDEDGHRIGSTMEWQDVTEQSEAEHRIEELIRAAAHGELRDRLETDQWEGFVRKVGDVMNELLEAVTTPVREATNVAASLSEGVLTRRVEQDFRGEFERLGSAINRSIDNLRSMLGKIQVAASTIARGSNELNEGNTNLSSRTEEQAAALEQTASTVEQLTSTVRQNAASANRASELASEARDKAEGGGNVVGQAVEAMSQINESSRKISDIIGVIDEIAFQTNLLALNAAVEAARAGEQGRGFAVVASEVRNLAQRSASAAQEIKVLIRDSVSKVEDGSRLVNQSGNTLKDIIHHVKNVSDIIAEIAAASEEQANGIEQVNQAVSQMDQMTQQNAALVEQAAAASASVDEQAQSLERLVQSFDIGHRVDLEKQSEPVPEREAQPTTEPSKLEPPPAAATFVPEPSEDEGDVWQEF